MEKNKNFFAIIQTKSKEELVELFNILKQLASKYYYLNHVLITDINEFGINTTKLYLELNREFDFFELSNLFNSISETKDDSNLNLKVYLIPVAYHIDKESIYQLFEINNLLELEQKIKNYYGQG